MGWRWGEERRAFIYFLFVWQALETKLSRVLAAVASGGSSFHSLMVLGRIENCPVFATVVVVGVAGRGINADDLGAAAVSGKHFSVDQVVLYFPHRGKARRSSPQLEGGPVLPGRVAGEQNV